MGQVANCQYVCDAINAYASRSYIPATGTASQIANVDYLMKMIDKATRDITGGGTAASNYQATYTSTQVVDTAGVSQVLPLIKWLVTAPGSITNGSITANYTYAKYGQSVTVTISPSSGYELNTISATGVALSGSGNTRTFSMPKSNVTISGSFKAIFQTQTWSKPGSYSCSLPVGTYKMTAVSGKGGKGGAGQYGNPNDKPGNSGVSASKIEKDFTITSTVMVTVVVGGNGGNGGYGSRYGYNGCGGGGGGGSGIGAGGNGGSGNGGNGGSGGNPGHGGDGGNADNIGGTIFFNPGLTGSNGGGGGGGAGGRCCGGGGGASGIDSYYYVIGGGGGGGAASGEFGATGGTNAAGGTVGDSNSSTSKGGSGGGGGFLSGTALVGTTTNESPYVKIELA
jgi:hypothetical protein